MRRAVCLSLFLASTAFAAQPLRLGFFRLDPVSDAARPASFSDESGYASADGFLLGTRSKRGLEPPFLLAYKAKSLDLAWAQALSAESASPLFVEQGLVLVGTRDNKLTAYATKDGAQVWQLSLDAFVNSRMSVAAGVVFLATANETLYAIDLASGALRWSYSAEHSGALSLRVLLAPVLAQGQLYYGLANGDLLCLESRSGRLLWKESFPSAPQRALEARFHDYLALRVQDSTLLLARADGFVAALDVGQPAHPLDWQRFVERLSAATFRGPELLLGLSDGSIVAYPQDGSEQVLWQRTFVRGVSDLLVFDERLVVLASGGHIAVLDKSGRPLWTDGLNAVLGSWPLYDRAAGSLTFSTAQGNLYRFSIDAK